MADRFSDNTPLDNSLICECEEVSIGEAKYALNELDVNNLVDLVQSNMENLIRP